MQPPSTLFSNCTTLFCPLDEVTTAIVSGITTYTTLRGFLNDQSTDSPPPIYSSERFSSRSNETEYPYHAALNGQPSTVELLLANSASIELYDQDRNTPLHLATWKRHTR